MELIAAVLADAFLLWETKSASGSCRRCAPTASITWPVFDAFALSEKGIALPRCSILVADRERSVPVSEIEGWFVCLVAVTFGALQCGQLAPFRD